jgi:hypothetical protein
MKILRRTGFVSFTNGNKGTPHFVPLQKAGEVAVGQIKKQYRSSFF